MYNIIGIWWKDQKLLTVKPIATLRYPKWNEMKNDSRQDERYMTEVIYQWKTTAGKMKDIWRSHISTRSAEALNSYDYLTDWLTSCWRYCHFLTDRLTDWPAAEDMDFLSSHISMLYAYSLYALVVSTEFRCGSCLEGNNSLISSLYFPLQDCAIQI